MAKERGIPTLASALIRPTTTQTPPEPAAGDPVDDQADAELEAQGRGAVAIEVKPRTRTRRAATLGEATKGRKLSLPDSVFDRLQLTAIQRRKTVSAIATEILDRNLPKLRIEREG
jgi:hypothetical protein